MPRFEDVDALQSHLIRLDEDYGRYALPLWAYGIRRSEQLANAAIDDLISAGIGNRIYAGDIKARSGGDMAGPSQTGSLKEGALFVDVLLEHDHIQCPASLLVDTGCDLELNLSEYKADQLGLKPDGFAASLEMGQGHMGRVLRRGQVLTTLLLEGEGDEVTKDPRRSRYLELWTDEGTGNMPSTYSSRRSSLAGSPTSPTRSSMLQIKVLSPILRGQDSRGHDAILGAPGMAALNLGIDKDTMRLYRKQTPKNFRKLRQQQS